ncbi:MAG: hypothetical protein H8E66_22410 [Planctomycetes bacterium]|nr:hypothetical protein [Planctomycetota bacterium]
MLINSRNPALNQPKPPPQTLQPDDERKIQIFLERASSIVLERPVLDRAHWRLLVSLAEELGLSDEELRNTIDDLRQRGVISDIDLSPLKPPPLPSQESKAKADVSAQAGPERDFSLTPPVPPPPPPVPQSKSERGPQAQSKAPPKQPVLDASREERDRRYLERAQAIIAEQRGLGGRTQMMLAATADEMGLSEEEATNALRSLNREPVAAPTPPPPTNGAKDADVADDSESDEALQQSKRWRVEGAPPPEPPPPPRNPEAIYRDYLSASLAQITDGIVPTLLEQKFVKHGTSVLGLAQTFSQHVVYDEAAEKGLQFESGQADADSPLTTSDENDSTDVNVKQFLERSAPILAQHRGINAKSRVLLNAIATELGLTEEQVDRAVATSQFRSTTPREDTDAQQQERLVGFRELVEGALISLPRKLLTFDIEENLRRHGEERHGIKTELVASALRDVCVALGIRQISEQQAREHIEQLVDSKLGESVRLSDDVRTRIESEGKQWGLSVEQVAAIIKERTRMQDQRHRSERNFTHGALLAAGVAALMVVGFFGWVAINNNLTILPPVEVSPLPPSVPAPIVVDDANVDTAWWGEELEFAISSARREMRSQRPMFIQIESKEAPTRRSAYGQLVKELFSDVHDDEQRDLLMRVISLCYARDPDQEAARRLLDDLIARIPRSERDLRANDELFPHAFLATQAAVSLVTQTVDERQDDASTELGRAIGRTIDAGLEPHMLQQHAYEGVAERLYRLLIALAKSEPALVAPAHAVIAKQTTEYLDQTKLEKLNTDFLVLVLSGASQTWREYETLIIKTVASESPINVIRILEVYEKTKDLDLQEFLAEAMIARLAEAPESSDVAGIASAVRKSLGATVEDVDNKRLTRFVVGANSLLDEPRVEVSEPEALLAEIVNLAYHSTLGCAVAQGNAGEATFDTLAAQDPAAFLTADETTAPMARDEPTPLEPTTLRMLNERLRMLLNPRTSPVTRFGFVETIAGHTDRVDDLAPEQAAALATYLLGKKRIEEYRATLPHVEEIGKWKQVRLAVADQIEEVGVSDEQLQEIASKLLGREYEVGKGDAGRMALRDELLRDVLADAKKEDVGGQNNFQVYNDAAQSLYDFYTAQAILFRVTEWPAEPVTPTVVVQAMIEGRTNQLLEAALSPAGKQQVQQSRVEMRAIDYLATNDFQRLVLLDRAWLKLLAVECVRRRPTLKAETDSLGEQLALRDRDAKHVLVQLRDGHETTLRMWLLLNRTN